MCAKNSCTDCIHKQVIEASMIGKLLHIENLVGTAYCNHCTRLFPFCVSN